MDAIMKYTVEMVSGAMTEIFINIGSGKYI
jgi:hypothetical protein